MDYHKQQDKLNNEKAEAILNGLPEFVSDYFLSLSNRSASSRTILEYAYEIRSFFEYLSNKFVMPIETISPYILETVRPIEIERYLSLKSHQGNTLSENARARKLSALRSFFNYYLKTKEIATNPCLLVDMTKKHKKEVQYLEQDEIKSLLNAAKNGTGLTKKELAFHEKTRLRDIAILSTLVGTGLRISELVGLNIADFDKKNAALHIIRKGGDVDEVYFGEAIERALEEYLDCGRELFHPADGEDALFLSIQGGRMSVRAMEKLVKKYAMAVNLPSATHPHTLRASFATNLADNGADVYTIKEALHHASLETSKHYVGGSKERKRKAARISDELFE